MKLVEAIAVRVDKGVKDPWDRFDAQVFVRNTMGPNVLLVPPEFKSDVLRFRYRRYGRSYDVNVSPGWFGLRVEVGSVPEGYDDAASRVEEEIWSILNREYPEDFEHDPGYSSAERP